MNDCRSRRCQARFEGTRDREVSGADNTMHVALAASLWKDPATWGIVLADLVRHVANTYNERDGLDKAEVVAKIRKLFEVELGTPTDVPTGSLQE